MGQASQRGKEWLVELLKLMGIDAVVTAENLKHPHANVTSCWLTIDHTNLSPDLIKLLIGEKGENIDGIQYLANTLLNIGVDPGLQQSWTIEITGYRARRQEELFILAKDVAEKVKTTGREEEVKSLSSAERRQIHTILQEDPELETESRGQEPDRRLVVRKRN